MSRARTMTTLELVLKIQEEALEVSQSLADGEPKLRTALELADLEYYLREVRDRIGVSREQVDELLAKKLAQPYDKRDRPAAYLHIL